MAIWPVRVGMSVILCKLVNILNEAEMYLAHWRWLSWLAYTHIYNIFVSLTRTCMLDLVGTLLAGLHVKFRVHVYTYLGIYLYCFILVALSLLGLLSRSNWPAAASLWVRNGQAVGDAQHSSHLMPRDN